MCFCTLGCWPGFYVEPSPFLLPPEQAFQRIPLGYLAFLMLTVGLFWLLLRLQMRGALAGLRSGLAAGGVLWGAFAMGLYSISTISWPLLLGWWIGQTVELGLAGAVLGAATKGGRLGRIWLVVVVAVVTFVAITITLQILGWAPAMKVAS